MKFHNFLPITREFLNLDKNSCATHHVTILPLVVHLILTGMRVLTSQRKGFDIQPLIPNMLKTLQPIVSDIYGSNPLINIGISNFQVYRNLSNKRHEGNAFIVAKQKLAVNLQSFQGLFPQNLFRK